MVRPTLLLRTLGCLAFVFSASTIPSQAAPRRVLFEANVWGGHSAISGSTTYGPRGGAAETGFRSAELAAWPTSFVRLFARYDNTLALDNLAIIRAGTRVPLVRVGAQTDWAGRFTTVGHVSYRTLPDNIRQTMLGGEQVAFTRGGTALKAGGWVGPRSDHLTEWLTHAGVNLAAGSHARLEPTLFYSRSGIAGEQQWRALLAGEGRLGSHLTVGGGLATGRNTSVDAALSGAASSRYARLSVRVGQQHKVHVQINRESAPGAGTLSTVAAGVSIGVLRP